MMLSPEPRFDVDLYGMGVFVGGGLALELARAAEEGGQRLDHLVLAYYDHDYDMDLAGLLLFPNDFWGVALSGWVEGWDFKPKAAPDTPPAGLRRMSVLGGPNYSRGIEPKKEAEFARSPLVTAFRFGSPGCRPPAFIA
ncbi:hypothetical protein HK405_002954 [Cladochytrium tenue]|nr:hypothetical protein HK405_002954 [Cladochytrium tenue]